MAAKKKRKAPAKRKSGKKAKGKVIATASQLGLGPRPKNSLWFFDGQGNLREAKRNTKGGTKGRRSCRRPKKR